MFGGGRTTNSQPAGQKYNKLKAYEAYYQQAVYHDGRNPTFWCSIGVLYFQINQFHDALDAYSRAIRINPYISEVWFDLGSLSLMPSTPYARAAELDPGNHVVSQRLQLFKNAQATGSQPPATPGPQDVHPNAYANPSAPPPGLSGPPLLLQSTSTRFLHRSESNYRGPGNNDNIHLPLPPVPISHSSPSPHFRGPPPPVSIDESWHPPSHMPLAPMDVDLHHQRDFSGPVREKCWSWPDRWPSMSFAAPPHPSTAAPDGGVAFFRQPRTTAALGVLQPSTTRVLGLYFACLSPHSPSLPWLELLRVCPSRSSANWSGISWPVFAAALQYASRSPGPRRVPSPMEMPPRSTHHSQPLWDSKPPSGPPHPPLAPSGPPESGHWRYDPARFDACECPVERDVDSRRQSGLMANSPEAPPRIPLHTSMHMSMSLEPSSAESKSRRKQPQPLKDKDSDTQSVSGLIPSDVPKKERKKRQRRGKEEQSARLDSNGFPPNMPASFKVASFSAKGGQDMASSSGSGNLSLQPSPTMPLPACRPEWLTRIMMRASPMHWSTSRRLDPPNSRALGVQHAIEGQTMLAASHSTSGATRNSSRATLSSVFDERDGGGKKYPALRDALEEEHDYSEEWDSGLDGVVSLEEWKTTEDLADIWCEWAEMELRHDHYLCNLEESVGTVESAKVVYDKIMELKIASTQIIVNYATFLENEIMNELLR
ncbi:hypothetical protein EDD15DRAFT_2412554 [Pisolithus albus]|nr:hypothetical protein EDD15DRAFT_2412554 [Pisolithus albus]